MKWQVDKVSSWKSVKLAKWPSPLMCVTFPSQIVEKNFRACRIFSSLNILQIFLWNVNTGQGDICSNAISSNASCSSRQTLETDF